MTREEQLDAVKASINIVGTHLDNTLGIWLDDVKCYMRDAGVTEETLNSEKAIGAICRGVTDLYVNGALSNYFYQRVAQLSLEVSE